MIVPSGPYILISLMIGIAATKKLPESFEKCHIKSENLDDCLKGSIQNALRSIGSTGIASLKVPSIDPMEVTAILVPSGSSAVKVDQHFFDVRLHGLSKAIVESAHLDYQRKLLNFTLYIDELIQNARYEVNGNILVLPVRGNGDSTITLSGLRVQHMIAFKERTKKDKTYFNVETYTIKLSVKKMQFDYRNLFDGNKILGDNINKVINENWEEVFADIQGSIEQAYAEVYKNFASWIFNYVPVDDIFLP